MSGSARQFLEKFFRERLDRLSARSPTGRQLESLRDETTHLQGTNPSALEERHIRYAMMVKIWGALTRMEQAVLFLQHAPLGPTEFVLAHRAVWPDALEEGSDPIASCGAKVVIVQQERKTRTFEVIATMLGITPVQVRYRAARGMRKISENPLLRGLNK